MNDSWLQILSLFLANAGLIIWFRTESRNDWRHMDNKMDAIQEEMKDFHNRLALQDQEFKMRLCAIEEKKLIKKV
jgi:hypothetical protein